MQRLDLCLLLVVLLIFAEKSVCFRFVGGLIASTSSRSALSNKRQSQFELFAGRSTNARVSSRSTSPRPNQRRRPVGFVSTKMNEIKKAKTGRIIRDELIDIICNGEIKARSFPEDELLRTVSIDDVEINNDFSMAKVYLTLFGNTIQKRQIFLFLCENIGQVRFELSKRLRSFRRVPIITFAMTDTQSEAYLNQVLDEISIEQAAKTAAVSEQDQQWEDMDFEEVTGTADDDEDDEEEDEDADEDDE